MKITTILKDIYLALASTLLFGGGIEYSVVISTTRSPHDITIFMNEDYNRALRLMKQINTARSLCFI